METVLFEDLDESKVANDRKPFFAIDHKNEEELLTWLKTEFQMLKKDNEEWHQEIKNNYKRFKEIQYKDQLYQQRDLPDRKSKYTPQYVAPLIRDLVDERVSRMMEYKPAVTVLPQHDENQDKIDAKIAKRFIKHIDKAERIDYKLQKFLRTCFAAGEAYIIPRWDPDKGIPHPDADKTDTLFVGDIDHKVFSPLRFMYEKTTDEQEPDYGFLIEYEYAEKLKIQYKSKSNDIEPDNSANYYDPITMEDKPLLGKCVKITFWHRKTQYLKQGFECVFIDKAILKKGVLPYKHGKIPAIKLSDNENLEESKGRSFINSIKGMVSYFNNLLNMSIKQMTLMSWAKWFVDAGSVDDQQLNNDAGIVKVKAGSRNPILAQGSPVSPQIKEWLVQSMEWVYSWGKSNSIIRGELPPGVTAFVAMQYVSESESRRLNTLVIKFNEAVRMLYEMDLSVCGQYYKKEDKRTMMILGKDNSWTAMNYDPASLAKPYSIVIQNASALPDSKGARTQYVIDLAKSFPDMFPKEQVVEMLDLGQSDKFLDDGAAAARCAEAENEMMMEGKTPPAPVESEFLITHWKVHTMAMQDFSFKTKASPEIRELFRLHVLATEMLMFFQARKSLVFTESLKQLSQFPIFWSESFDSLMMPEQLPLPGGAPEEQLPPEALDDLSQGLPPSQEGPSPMESAPVADNQLPIGQVNQIY